MTALRVDGVDLSHHQSQRIDWAAAKAAGVKFVYHKASEGTTVWDERYASRRTEVGEAGIPFGAYHFARPDGGDAKAEAERFLKIAQPAPGDLFPMLDLEDDGGLSNESLTDWALSFIGVIRREVGVFPLLYTPFVLEGNLGCLLWRARYNDDNREPRLDWDIHQFSDGNNGTPNQVAGLGHVDLSHMRDGLSVEDFTIPDDEPRHTAVETARTEFLAVIAKAQANILPRRADILADIEAMKQTVLAWPER